MIQSEIKIKDVDENGDVIGEKPTNAFGYIKFKETTKKTKGKFVRFSTDTDPSTIYNLMIGQWRTYKPRLIISVTGVTKSLNIDPALKQKLKDGILKASQTSGTWIITRGVNTGVMKLVGDALNGTTNTCIGIIDWNTVAGRKRLESHEDYVLGSNTFTYQPGSYKFEDSDDFYLDHNHSHFLLVDGGKRGGKEVEEVFRRKFEDYIVNSRQYGHKDSIAKVLLVTRGGHTVLNTICHAIQGDNPTPCVLVKGMQGIADLIVYAIEHYETIKEKDSEAHNILVKLIESVYSEKTMEEKNEAYKKIIECVNLKERLTIADIGREMNVDEAILTALLQNQKKSPYEQLKLTILWNRADIAENEIIAPMKQWNVWTCDTNNCTRNETRSRELQNLMIMALALNEVAMVKLFMNYAMVSDGMNKLLTTQTLGFLYAYRFRTAPSVFAREFRDEDYVPLNELPMILSDDSCRNIIGELLFLGSIDERYCLLRRGLIVKRTQELCEKLFIGNVGSILETDKESADSTFEYPFRELYFWAVLNNMMEMAQFLWAFEEEALSKALIAADMSKTLIERATPAGLPTASLHESAKTYQTIAYQLLETCYKRNEDLTKKLVTSSLDHLPDVTCLDLAIRSTDMEFTSHCCVQGILNDVWRGKIDNKVPSREIVSAFFFPFLLSKGMFVKKIDDEKKVECGEKYVSLWAASFEVNEDCGDTYCMKEDTTRPIYKQMFLFYCRSPMVKFYAHAVGYVFFMMLFAYIALINKHSTTAYSIPELLLKITIFAFTVGEVYQILNRDAPNLRTKFFDYLSEIWNILDCVCVLIFIVACVLIEIEDVTNVGHLLYAVDCSLWMLRWLQVLYVHPISGPYVFMIGRMFKDMLYFLIILLVFMVAHGIAHNAILNPKGASDVYNAFTYTIVHPYFNIYGELFAGQGVNDNSTTEFGTRVWNSYAEPLAWVYLSVYLLIANVLLLNLLIAIFGNTYEEVKQNSDKIWKFERYRLVVEFSQQRIALVPPFSLLGHFYLAVEWLIQVCMGGEVKKRVPDGALKFEPTRKQKEELNEFESRCLVEVTRAQKESNAMQSSEGDVSIEKMLHQLQIERKKTEHQACSGQTGHRLRPVKLSLQVRPCGTLTFK